MSCRRAAIVGLLVVVAALGCAPSEREAPVEATQPPLYLYLLAGQSNMAGRGAVESNETPLHPRLFALNSAMEWGPARDPLHFDKPTIAGVGPGSGFGPALAEHFANARIGLIPAAVGGSSIRAWVPGGVHDQTNSRPWDDALSRTFRVMALQGGILKGVIWHQGESDSQDFAEQYEDALVDLVERFRRTFRSPDLPFVAGQLAPFFLEKRPQAATVNAAISRLPQRAPHTAFVTAEELVHNGDGTHFDSASARELGRRYAEAMIQLHASQKPCGYVP